MARRTRKDLENQVVSLEVRVRELRQDSARVAQDLIALAGGDRRQSRSPHVERMLERVHAEVSRLEEEAQLADGAPTGEEVERHLARVEQQLQDVLAEREEWVRESLRGRRRRSEDLRTLDWLREEQERLTAELLRCARLLQQVSVSKEEARLRRVWKMLRLTGE